MDPLSSSGLDINFFAALVFALFNVFVSLFFVNKYLMLSRKYKRLNQKENDKKKIILEFLNEQHLATVNHKRNPDNIKMENEVSLLRKAYLKIEHQALSKHIPDSNAYLQFLNEQLLRLLKILLPQHYQRKTPNNNLKEKIEETKKRFKELSKSQNKSPEKFSSFSQTLDELATKTPTSKAEQRKLTDKLDKINSIITIYKDDDLRKKYVSSKKKAKYADSGSQSVTKMKRASDRAEITIDHLDSSAAKENIEKELQLFKSENKKLKNNLQSLQDQFNKIGKTSNAVINSISNPKAESVDDLSDEILEANEREIDRLRGVISSQRNSIMEMEDTIQKLDNSSTESNTEEIEKLKRCISESEVCIQILETELDELKVHLDEIKAQKGMSSNAEKEELSNEVGNPPKKPPVLKVEFSRNLYAGGSA